jgi:hypothetical protein
VIVKLESVPGSEMTAYLGTSKAIVLQKEWLFFFSSVAEKHLHVVLI